MNVQAFLNNVSFPKNLEELDYYKDEFDVETLQYAEWAEWTTPKWAVPGDIVLFFHAKTAIQQISRLETELKNLKRISTAKRNKLEGALHRARKLYRMYGGKIFAIGKIAEQPFYDAHPFMSEEEEQERNIHFRTNRRIFAKVDEIFLLEKPIDISEFSDFIFVSRQSAITPVVGSDFNRLKKIICAKNEMPDYLKKSRAIPLPLQKINPENWLDVTQEYRRLFALEIQFRRFYVDYFLKVLGQQKTFYAECECYQQGRRTGFADNAIKIGGKWCFVEVKLNVHTEPHLHDQLKKYCHAERVILQKGERTLPQEKVWQNTMLVIDTEDFYIYSVSSDQLTLLESLDKIKTESNIKALQKRILPLLN